MLRAKCYNRVLIRSVLVMRESGLLSGEGRAGISSRSHGGLHTCLAIPDQLDFDGHCG